MTKTLQQKISEFSNIIIKENKNRNGIYMIGIESETPTYGFSEDNPRLAMQNLRSKGYTGQVVPIDVSFA